MTTAPVTHIDLARFAADPYPALADMRARAPVTFVPELGATLITLRDDIHREEKRTEVLSSDQPDGLMTRLMGTNMMRKDGEAHMVERRALFPALSPRTVNEHWKPIFEASARDLIKRLAPRGKCDLVRDFAMPVSARALKAITGLETMTEAEMDGVSQAMINGCANYAGDKGIEATCNRATRLIDDHIAHTLSAPPERSALAAMIGAGLPLDSIKANIKLVISGGQNEPRDAIAGTIWALLKHPSQRHLIRENKSTYAQAFAEYARWISPIGMSPRRIAQASTIGGFHVDVDDRIFLMYGSGNRDEAHFAAPDCFDLTRNVQPAISFGAGPHFCAGAAAARCLITEVALPLAFTHLRNLALDGDVPFTGWAFRGPTKMPVTWDS